MSMDDDRRDGPDEDKLLVGEFALGLLHATEHERLTRRIAADPALLAELRRWQSRLAGLDAEYAETPPPAGVLGKVEARIFAPEPATSEGIWNSLMLWRGIAAVSLAIAALAIGINLLQPARLDPQSLATELVAALQAQEGSGVEFVALYDTATGSVRLTALSGEAMSDRDYELWMIEASGTPVSMGVVPVSRTSFTLPEPMQGHLTPGTVLAVTIEPKGGSPTGGPTGPIVAMGKAAAI